MRSASSSTIWSRRWRSYRPRERSSARARMTTGTASWRWSRCPAPTTCSSISRDTRPPTASDRGVLDRGGRPHGHVGRCLSDPERVVRRPGEAAGGVAVTHHRRHSRSDPMTATYTFDIFSTLDGYGSYGPGGDWGGYWGKQGPELLEHRLASFGPEQRMVFGATTFRQFVEMLAESTEASDVRDPWVTRMR